MELVVPVILAVLGSSAVTAGVMAYFQRHKVAAETDQIRSSTAQGETVYYQQRVEETIGQMRLLETEVKQLKVIIETAQTQYEQRVGGLHTKMDNLVRELERANTALDMANETITHLRQEVKDGNAIITELRKEITLLLVDKAEAEAESKAQGENNGS